MKNTSRDEGRRIGAFTPMRERLEAKREITGLEQGDQQIALLTQLVAAQTETNRLLGELLAHNR